MNKQGNYWPHWYDLLWSCGSADPLELNLLREWATVAGRVVDVGAGTGRIALPLAASGVHIYAVEPDPAMRSAMLTKLAQKPALWPNVTVLPATAADFQLTTPVDLIYGCGMLFHLLTNEEQLAMLHNLHQQLTPGGRLILDSVGRHQNEPALPPTLAGEVTVGEMVYRATMSREIVGPTLHNWRFVYETEYQGVTLEQFEAVTLARVVKRAELLDWLAETGFEPEAEYADYENLDPIATSTGNSETPQTRATAIIVARKR